MLPGLTADTASVFHRCLVLAAFGCSLLVLASFALFARDQVAGASKAQESQLVASTPGNAGAPASTTRPAQPRRFIDGAAKTLTSPFASIVQSNSQWVRHGLPTLCALLVFGFGLGFLARYSRGLS
jgi:hypothetical protein